MSFSNLGRAKAVREAFIKHVMTGIDQLMPITDQLAKMIERPRETRMAVCPARMVDDVNKMLDQYQRASNGGAGAAINAPLPVVLLAFAKGMNPITVDRGRSLADINEVMLRDDSGAYYPVKMAHNEWRVQLCFIAHEQETAIAITNQLRLYIQEFQNKRWPIEWHHDGNEFTTTCSLDNYEPMDDPVDVPDRTNLIIYVWDLTLTFQMPFVYGTPKGTVQQVNMDIDGKHDQHINGGYVNGNDGQLPHGEWNHGHGDQG